MALSLNEDQQGARSRKEAMTQAYLSGAYTMAEIGDHFGVHYYDGEPRSARIGRNLAGNVGVEKFKNSQKPFMLHEGLKTPIAWQDVQKVRPARPQGIWRAERTAVREHGK